jgi:predicted phosphodiesterase
MKVDLILTSDWHLREDTPPCRTDNFWEAQWDKVGQVRALQVEHHCPVLHAGDLYHHWKPSPYLLTRTYQELPENFITVAGQHDLPNHSLELAEKCGLYNLNTTNRLEWDPTQGNWGQEPWRCIFFPNRTPERHVAVWHRFVWDGKEMPWPDCKEMTAKEILKKYPQYDLIVTGDHHKPFTYEYKGRLLVNCGCLTRQAADYADHRPRVWLWNAETNTVVPHYLKVNKQAVSREHLEQKEERDKRIDAFVSRLSDTWEVGISFEENLKRFISSNQVRKSVVDLIYKALE